MTIMTAGADTAPVPTDETSKRARGSKPTPAGVDAALVGQLVARQFRSRRGLDSKQNPPSCKTCG
jgi:hypothetical protein